MSQLSATRWTVVQAAQAGDDAALRALFDKYRPAVLGYLMRRGLKDDAEDVAQEVCVQLLRALAKADRSAGRFRSLVFAISRNLIGKHYERATAQKRGGGERIIALGEHDVAQPEHEEAFDREWLGTLIRSALARLADEHPNYFLALERFLLREQPQLQIAKELGISTGAVKKHVFRGKKKLVGYLREEVWRYATSAADYEAELRELGKFLGPGALLP